MPSSADPSGLDRLVHEPARLTVLAVLSAVDEADFVFLLAQTGLTKGNLSSHLAKLEAAGYVRVDKGFRGKVPHTRLRLLPAGREALEGYRRHMARVLDSLPGAEGRAPRD